MLRLRTDPPRKWVRAVLVILSWALVAFVYGVLSGCAKVESDGLPPDKPSVHSVGPGVGHFCDIYGRAVYVYYGDGIAVVDNAKECAV